MTRFAVAVMLAGGFALAAALAPYVADAQQGGQGGPSGQSGPSGQGSQSGSSTQAGQNDPAAQLAQGKAVFDKWCAPCHGDGPGKPGTAALQAMYQGRKPALLEQRTDLVPEVTKTVVRTGVSVMPFFRKTEISDTDLDALAAYLAQ
jgi:mono/diheme cytochrome c family protein